jgi:hypothetical protein
MLPSSSNLYSVAMFCIFDPKCTSNGNYTLLDHCDFKLVETDPKFFPSPASPGIIRAAVNVGFDPLFPGLIPEIQIRNKSNFIYDCPGVDEIFYCVNLGGIGTRFNLAIYDNDFLINGQNSIGVNIDGGYNIQSTAEILLNSFNISAPIPQLFSSYQSSVVSGYKSKRIN